MAQSGPNIVGGRYAIYDEIASGGMATVHFGCTLGAGSFSRIVAVKRLHAHLANEHEFVNMFLDEARVAARIRHPNVVPTLDVVASPREVFIVMEYVHGESLSKLFSTLRERRERLPLPVAASIVVGLLGGLHAAHEATGERGELLRIVHRDVSPQNLIVGHDGIARIVDFGIAKAVGRMQQTQTGEIKGKFGYMAPEQVNGAPVTRAADIYAAGVVLWETLTGRPLFKADSDVQLAAQVLLGQVAAPSVYASGVPISFDDIVMCALDRDPARRFSTAREMARAIEAATPVASPAMVAEWVESLAGVTLGRREQRLAEIESDCARTGSIEGHFGGDAEPHRDASTRAVTYAATTSDSSDPEDGTRVEGRRRPPRDAGLLDSIDRDANGRRRRLGPWIVAMAAATLVSAALMGRRDQVRGWLQHGRGDGRPAASPAPVIVISPPPVARPRATVSAPALPPPTPTVLETVPVEQLPVAAPPSVPIESLPRVVEPARPVAGARVAAPRTKPRTR
jgi:serine/threonine-protein kinase